MLAVLILPQVGRRANREGTMMTNAIRTLVLLLTIISPACVHAGVMIFNDFNDTSTLTLNGDAAVANTSDGAVLRLTPALTSKSGSAFSSVTVKAATFSTAFTFRITNPGGPLFDGNSESGADGLVFVAQSVSSAIGGFGQGIGYAGISNSVGVEFDTWHNSVNNDPN